MATWIKPSGVKVETNEMEETIDYCVSLGWEPYLEPTVDPEDVDASGVEFDPVIHYKNRRMDADGNWLVKKGVVK